LGAALGEVDVEPGALTGEVLPELADDVLEKFGDLSPAGLDGRCVLLAGQGKRSQRDSGRGFLTRQPQVAQRAGHGGVGGHRPPSPRYSFHHQQCGVTSRETGGNRTWRRHARKRRIGPRTASGSLPDSVKARRPETEHLPERPERIAPNGGVTVRIGLVLYGRRE